MKRRFPYRIFARASAGPVRRINSWLSIRDATADEPAQVLIYDQIGKDWWSGTGVEVAAFKAAWDQIPKSAEIQVRIHSPGGDVFDGLAIYNLISERRSKVSVRIDGLAGSIASIIALAGRDLTMPANAWYMIHDPSGLVIGNAGDMRELADLLDRNADMMAGIYAQNAGGTREEWRQRMRDETWYNGEEAKTAGIADSVTQDQALAASFNLSGCRRVPAALQPRPPDPRSQTPDPRAQTPDPIPPMKRTEILALFASLSAPIAAAAADAVLLAELQKLHTAGKVTAEEFQELTGQKPVADPPPAPAPAAPTPPAPAPATATIPAIAASAAMISREEFQAVQNALKAERDKRISAEVKRLAAENPNIDEAEWLPRVLSDETMLGLMAKIPKPDAAILDPVRRTPVTNSGNPLLDKYRGMRAGLDRQTFRLQNFADLQHAQRRFNPRAANTLDAALVTDWLADGLVVVATQRLAALAGFSRDFGVDQMKPRATVQVRKATAGATSQTNPTNFETGDSAVDNIPVTVNQISQSFHITNDELNSGFRMQHLAEKNAMVFANALSDIWTALILDATYASPAAVNIGAATVFDQGTVATLYGTAKNFTAKNLILDGSYVGRIVATINPFAFKQAPAGDKGAFGFDFLAEQNRWTNASANTVGIVCAPPAIAVASGLPLDLPPGEFLELGSVSLESLGLTVQTASWFSRAGRVWWSSFDVMFGAAAGDTTQLARLKSA